MIKTPTDEKRARELEKKERQKKIAKERKQKYAQQMPEDDG